MRRWSGAAAAAVAAATAVLGGGAGAAIAFTLGIPMTIQWWTALGAAWLASCAFALWPDSAVREPSRASTVAGVLGLAIWLAVAIATIASIVELMQIMARWDREVQEGIAVAAAALFGPLVALAVLLLLVACCTAVGAVVAARTIWHAARWALHRQGGR